MARCKNLFVLIENIRNIFDYLYKDATIFLPRKYDKFCKII